MFASALSYIPPSVVNSVNRIRGNAQQLLSDIYYLATKQPTVAVVLCLAALVQVGMAATINAATSAQDESKLSKNLNLDGISFIPPDEMGSVDIVNELGNRIFCFGEQAYRVNYGQPNFAQIMQAINKGTNSACALVAPVTTTMDKVIACLELGTQLVFFNSKTNTESPFINKVSAEVCKKGLRK